MTILELQKALKSAGFDPGPLDGIAGPKTRNALRAFQSREGLEVDGIAGPKTQGWLLGQKKAPTANDAAKTLTGGDIPAGMPWMAEAKRLIGVTEDAGAANDPAIMGWADKTGIAYSNDETPWCGLFVAHCVTATIPEEPLPANPLGARQWLKFGKEVSPQFGSVLVFWRGSKDGWTGHVAFYWAEDDLYFYVLGGNQSNAVNVTKIAKSRLLGARWPTAVAPMGLRRQTAATSISVSTDER